jgi:hypothetical protein
MTSIAEQLRRQGWSPEAIATATVDGKPIAEASAKQRRQDGWPGYDSQWEEMYAGVLACQKAAGEIIEWQYHAITLRLTEPTVVEGKKKRGITYTPDFVVWLPDGRVRFVEIKGYRRTKDINRYKLAKDKFRQAEFVMLSRRRGLWEVIL